MKLQAIYLQYSLELKQWTKLLATTVKEVADSIAQVVELVDTLS